MVEDPMKRILVVDDNTDFNMLLATILRKKEFQVDQAYDGLEAFKLAVKEKYDLVLMDIKMPNMNGEECINALYEADPRIRFIVISGNMHQINRQELRKKGVIDFYEKPVDAIELSEKLAVMLKT